MNDDENNVTNVTTLSGTPYRRPTPTQFRPLRAEDRIPAIRLGLAAGPRDGLVICGAAHFDTIMMRTVLALGMDGTELVNCDLGYVDRMDHTEQFISGYYPGRVFRP